MAHVQLGVRFLLATKIQDDLYVMYIRIPKPIREVGAMLEVEVGVVVAVKVRTRKRRGKRRGRSNHRN